MNRWIERYATGVPHQVEGGTGGAGGGSAGGAPGAPGVGQKPWYDGIEPEIIGHWDNKGWKKDDARSVAVEATKQAREAQKHFGVPPDRVIKIPDEADDPLWKNVYAKIGVPGEANGYDFAGITFADGTGLDDGFVASMRDALHAAHVPKDRAPDVVKAVVKFLDEAEASEKIERTAKLAAEKSELAKSWGPNGDRNRLAAMQGAKRLGVDPATIDVLEQQVGYAKVMEMFRRIGEATSEDTFIESRTGGSGAPATLEGVIARKAELSKDQNWVKRYLANDTEAVREMANLNSIIAASMPPA